MKQICIARHTDDVAALLGQCQRVMATLRANPDAEQVYTNTHMDGITGLDVLASPTAVEIHTTGQDSFTITLNPDAIQGIDALVTAALPGPRSATESAPSPAPHTPKGRRG